jgi:hypothetical protein
MNRLNLSPFEQAYILAAVQQHRDALTLLGLNKAEAEALAERKAELISKLEESLALGEVNPGHMLKFLLQLELEQDLLDLYRRYAAERKN